MNDWGTRIKAAESKALEIQSKLLHSRSELDSNVPEDILAQAEVNFSELQNSASELLQAVVEFEVGVKYRLTEIEQKLSQNVEGTRSPSQNVRSPEGGTGAVDGSQVVAIEIDVDRPDPSLPLKIEPLSEEDDLECNASLMHAMTEITAVLKTEEVD